jgi:hypothetical protein
VAVLLLMVLDGERRRRSHGGRGNRESRERGFPAKILAAVVNQ